MQHHELTPAHVMDLLTCQEAARAAPLKDTMHTPRSLLRHLVSMCKKFVALGGEKLWARFSFWCTLRFFVFAWAAAYLRLGHRHH